MTNEQAKFVLHAYRANGADAGDATFAEALEHTRRDPALEKWFAAQQAFDRAMCAKLGAVQPPAGLRDAILAGASVSRARGTARSAWWRAPGFVALAASLALVAAVSLAIWPKEASAHAPLIDFALHDTLRNPHAGQHGAEAAEFQTLLSATDSRLGAGLDVDFQRLRERGCRTVFFEGRELLEVCFKRDGKWFHCYVARARDFPAIAAKLKPTFRDDGKVSAGAWSDGQHIFIVASRAGREAIQRLI